MIFKNLIGALVGLWFNYFEIKFICRVCIYQYPITTNFLGWLKSNPIFAKIINGWNMMILCENWMQCVNFETYLKTLSLNFGTWVHAIECHPGQSAHELLDSRRMNFCWHNEVTSTPNALFLCLCGYDSHIGFHRSRTVNEPSSLWSWLVKARSAP